MEKIGYTLKLLRESRNLSQREVANGVMDFSYYSRVENDKVNITFSKLTKLLKKMNISMEEFLFLNNKSWKNEEEDLLDLISKAHYEADIKELEILKLKCAQKFNESKQWNDRYSYLLCVLILSRQKKIEVEQKYIDEILGHLNSLSYFTKIDVRALCEFYTVLPPKMVFYLFEKMFLEKKRHSAFEVFETNVLLFYFNMIDLSLKQEQYDFANKILVLAKKEFNRPLDLFAKVVFSYFDGIFLIISKENIGKGIEMAEDTIRIFESYRLEQPAKVHRRRLDFIIQRITPKGD